MDYSLTNKQQEGLNISLKRFQEGKPYTVIAGYAGTGKSYLVNAIVDSFGFEEHEVAYACYTGKAALVLQKQGKNATTLHKLLYKSYPNGRGGFVHRPKDSIDESIQLIIVDEISMCPKDIWKLLLKHKRYIIALGDPFQLPPIGEDLGLLNKPHVFLTEVMRQALDNDIIKYSMELRAGKDLQPGIRGTNIQTYHKTELTTGMMKWADQILCGKNDTRQSLNTQMREILGKKGLLDEGDKMICTKNYWEYVSSKENILVNGCIGHVHNVGVFGEHVVGDFDLEEDNTFGPLKLDYNLLTKGKPTVLTTPFGKVLPNPYKELEYGYAITVHKAQGSQFDKVLVYDDYWSKGEMYRRWLYTAITRAVDKVVILL